MRSTAFLAALALAGCTGIQTTDRFEANLKVWVNRPIAEYLATRGERPYDVSDDADGKLYTFADAAPGERPMRTLESSNVYRAGNGSGSGTQFGGVSGGGRYTCTWKLHADATGHIDRYSWKGNSCKA
jgi:hypothetical protein